MFKEDTEKGEYYENSEWMES